MFLQYGAQNQLTVLINPIKRFPKYTKRKFNSFLHFIVLPTDEAGYVMTASQIFEIKQPRLVPVKAREMSDSLI